MTKANQLSLLALFSSLLVVAAVRKTPQGLYSDPAWQLEALQQYVEGRSISINHTANPITSDLTQSVMAWDIWWPPATQMFVYPFARHHMTLGLSIRIIASVGLVVGAVGWARWFACFDLSPIILFALVFLIPWMRYASNNLFLYSAEIFMFASAPWLLLAASSIAERWWRADRWKPQYWAATALLGFALGFRYCLKYSGVLMSLGIATFLIIELFPRQSGRRWIFSARGIAQSMLLGLALLAPVLGLCWVNFKLGNAMNGASATAGWYWRSEGLMALLSNPALALGDADSLLRFTFLNPNRPLFAHEIGLRFLGLPGGLLIVVILCRARKLSVPARLAVTVLAVSWPIMAAVWNFSQVADYAARHLMSPSISILPLILQEGAHWWSSTSQRRTRWILSAAGLLYIAVPLAYGYISVFAKVIRTPETYVCGPAELY
ncbi:MAG TPA: hypothetical protein VMU17_02775, partial [Elusimicrobiota bacterium]|nr:hypothetical protein [Elusimicrobiota bacterium]